MNHKTYNIVFFGTSEFAVPALEALIKNSLVPLVVVTVPDKPAGRGKKISVSAIKNTLQSTRYGDLGIKLIQPVKIDAEFLLQISNLHPDVGVVASYGKILPKALLDMFPFGLLNVHPSLLPKYRGPSPIQGVILNGDEKTGVTIMLVDEKMDHGPILAVQELAFSILNYQFLKLHGDLAQLGANLLVETLHKWLDKKISPIPQDESKATFTKMIKKENGLIDWSYSPEYIEKMVRAYNPWPGTYTKMKDGKILKIKKVEIVEGKIKPVIVQPEGKKEMSYEAFLRGHPDFMK